MCILIYSEDFKHLLLYMNSQIKVNEFIQLDIVMQIM